MVCRERFMTTEVMRGVWDRKTDFSKFVSRIYWMDATQVRKSGFVRVLIIKARYPLLQILHQTYQIYVGLRYEHCPSVHPSDTVSDLHHGQPGGIHCPMRVYLLHPPLAATGGKLGIKCALSSPNLAERH
jgi:hypothetical protein